MKKTIETTIIERIETEKSKRIHAIVALAQSVIGEIGEYCIQLECGERMFSREVIENFVEAYQECKSNYNRVGNGDSSEELDENFDAVYRKLSGIVNDLGYTL